MTQDPRIRREKIMHRNVLAGNEDAWRTWYDEHFDGLFSHIWWRSGGRPLRGKNLLRASP